MPSIFSDIRASCARVAAEAEHVHVVGDVRAYARAFDLQRVRAPEYDAEHHFRGSEEDTVAYVLALDAVNFGSGWFPHLRTRPDMSGYHTIASRLADHVRDLGPLRAEALAWMRKEDAAEIFGQPLDDPARVELMALFADAWRQLGALLLDRFAGSPTALVRAAGGRAEILLRILSSMPAFRDVHQWRGVRVPFYKRAQITASDLALALGGEGLGAFEDLDALTVFADDLVPHVLRVDGILAYDDALAARIRRGELLEAGSPEEVEIRAVAVDAVERMVRALREDGEAVSARAFDVALWNRGQDPAYRAEPRHRTRTVYY